MSLIKKLAGETAIYGIPTILSRVLNFFIIASYMTSLLSDNQYGVMQMMFVVAAAGMVFFTYRMETTLFRFGSQKEDAEKSFTTAATMIVISTAVLIILVLLLAKPLTALFLKEGLHRYFFYFAGILAFDALAAVPFAKLRLENRAKWFASLKVVNIILNICILLLCFEVLPRLGYHYDPMYKLDIVFLSNLITSLVVLMLIVPTYRTSEWNFDMALAKRMISYTWPLAVIALAGVINQNGQFTLLKWIYPEGGEVDAMQIVGRYGGATKLAIFMSLFTTAFNFAAEPFFFKQAAGSDDRSVYGKVAAAYTLVATTVFLGIIYYIDIIQLLLRKPEFREAVDAVPTLLLAFLFLGLYYNVAIWYKLSDKTKYGMLISLSGTVITIVLNILLIPIWGYHGCAIATLACFIFMVVVCYYYGQRLYPIDYPVGRILKYIFLGLIFWRISAYIRPSFDGNLVSILGVNTLLLLGFLGLIYFTDRKYLRSLLS